MQQRTLTLLMRNWSFLAPLRDGRVKAEGLDLHLPVMTTTNPIADDASLDGGETSFSGYIRARIAGDDRLAALPVWPMRAFRERCILVAAGSVAWSLDTLRGGRVGLTGWANSGNIWTRAVLRRHGIESHQVEWYDGILTPESVSVGSDPTTLPPFVHAISDGPTLLECLLSGSLDAVFAPFMPPALFAQPPLVRHIFPDVRAEELRHYRSCGYMPGIHVLTIRSEILRDAPWVARNVQLAIEKSKALWRNERRHLADGSPWELMELEQEFRVFGPDWMPSGFEENRPMISQFLTEMNEQGIVDATVDAASLFNAPSEGIP